MGIQQQGPNRGGVDLKAFVPADWAGETLCTRVVSSNGLYEAENEYSVTSDWKGGLATLPYPTIHGEQLSQIEHDAISARLHLGDCSETDTESTVVSWNDGNIANRHLLINSFQADAVFVYVGNEVSPIRCEPITLDGKSAYDTKCNMNAFNAGQLTQIEVLRIVDGNAAPPTKLSVWLSGF